MDIGPGHEVIVPSNLNRDGSGVVGRRELRPCEKGRGDGEDEQDSGFVDGAAEGHAAGGADSSTILGAGNATAVRAVGHAAESIAAKGGIGRFE
jgi:hypothetical protein